MAELGGRDDIAATALAIAFLETKVSSQRAAWELVVAKARMWLDSQVGGDAMRRDALVEKAATYLSGLLG